jgi:L-ascorbate metabolism protein UlaG (beta-lactamase superfamily)
MRKKLFFTLFFIASFAVTAPIRFESDDFKTTDGVLSVAFIGHASLLFHFSPLNGPDGINIYVDPDGRLADFSRMPKADLVLVTHGHGDHFDVKAIAALRQASTEIIVAPVCQPLPASARTLKNGDHAQFRGMAIDAVPAYNIVHQRADGRPFHPRGEGNGYVLSFPGLRIYVAGDTENIPEMAAIKDIAIAFLPMNLPYTMTPEMTALAAKMITPRVLYPYHFSDTDPQRLLTLLQGTPGIDVRIRKLN